MGLIRGAIIGGLLLAALSLYFQSSSPQISKPAEPMQSKVEKTAAAAGKKPQSQEMDENTLSENAKVQETAQPGANDADQLVEAARETAQGPADAENNSGAEIIPSGDCPTSPSESQIGSGPDTTCTAAATQQAQIDTAQTSKPEVAAVPQGSQSGEVVLATESWKVPEEPKDILKFQAEPVLTTSDKRMSVVVIIDEPDMLGPETLVVFSQPVSFAVASDLPDRDKQIKVIRDLGYDAFILPTVPQSENLSDFTESFDANSLSELEVFGLMEPFEGAFQQSRPMTEATIEYAKSNGRGLLFYTSGPSAARTMAQREGVPAFTVFRTLPTDGANTDTDGIRRVLNQGTLRAASGEPVVLVGRLTQSLISGLILWGLEDSSRGVTLVPASQILAAQVQNDATAEVAKN